MYKCAHSDKQPHVVAPCGFCVGSTRPSPRGAMSFSFTKQVLVQHDLLVYWKETAAYKIVAYFLPKLLGEKVATLLLAPAHCTLFLYLQFSNMRAIPKMFPPVCRLFIPECQRYSLHFNASVQRLDIQRYGNSPLVVNACRHQGSRPFQEWALPPLKRGSSCRLVGRTGHGLSISRDVVFPQEPGTGTRVWP